MAVMQLGSTVQGRKAALKILHPCGERMTEAAKYPDGAFTSSVVMERRDEFEIDNKITAGGTPDWNCVIVDLPLLKATQVAIQWLITTDPTEAELVNVLQIVLSQSNTSGPFLYPDWGPVTVNSKSFAATILISSTLSRNLASINPTLLDADGYFREVRRTYLGSTIDYDAPSLTDQGRVIAGQWAPDIVLDNVLVLDGSSNEPAWRIDPPPMTSSAIVQSDLQVYQARSKFGLYMPVRIFSPTIEPTPATAQELSVIVNSSLGIPAFRPADITAAGLLTDLALKGWNSATSLWLNISHDTVLRLKRKEGIELVPAGDSVYSPFSTPALPDDLKARAIMREYSRMEPHGFPADYNELGGLFADIVDGIGGALQSLGFGSGFNDFVGGIQKGFRTVVANPVSDALIDALV